MAQLSLSSGKTKRKFTTLSSIQDSISLTATSPKGSIMAGLLAEGDLFVWDKSSNSLSCFVTPLSKMEKQKIDPKIMKGEI